MVRLYPIQSSSIRALGYEPDRKRLYVRYLESGDMYVYYDVDADVFDNLLQADSKGGYVNRQIRGHYAFEKLPHRRAS